MISSGLPVILETPVLPEEMEPEMIQADLALSLRRVSVGVA
jgi:hypothetical protein